MFYKKGTTISNVGINYKIAEVCPDGYITFDEMKYGTKDEEMVVPVIEEVSKGIAKSDTPRKYNKRSK